MEERSKVIGFIQEQQKGRFRVIDNTGTDKKIVGGTFPDMIFMQKVPPPNNNLLFLLKIETEDDLVNKVSEWKSLGSTSSAFYVVVPRGKLDEAKRIASVAGVRARFAWYNLENDKVKELHYE
jgi:hypothetical protein